MVISSEIFRKDKHKQMQEIAPKISKIIIELGCHLTTDSVGYWYHELPKELQQFTKEELSLFLGWLDLHDNSLIISCSTDETRSFPNNQYQTIYGVTFDITFGQGSSVCVYANAK